MNHIYDNVYNLLPKYLQLQYKQIDEAFCDSMDLVKKKCRKLYIGVIPWLLTYKNKARNGVLVYENILPSGYVLQYETTDDFI